MWTSERETLFDTVHRLLTLICLFAFSEKANNETSLIQKGPSPEQVRPVDTLLD